MSWGKKLCKKLTLLTFYLPSLFVFSLFSRIPLNAFPFRENSSKLITVKKTDTCNNNIQTNNMIQVLYFYMHMPMHSFIKLDGFSEF